MTIAASGHLSRGEGLRRAAHAIENGIVFLSLIFIGPGKYSLDEWLKPQKRQNK
jgi:putative oxidoreductase